MADTVVCVAIRRFYPLYSGPGVRTQRIAPGLIRRGVGVRVFTEGITGESVTRSGLLAHQFDASSDGASDCSTEEIDGLLVQRTKVPRGWRRQPLYFHGLVKYCRERPHDIDVVQFLNLDKLAAPWILQLHRLGIRTVYSCTLLGELSPHPFRRALQRLERRFALNLVDQVTAMTTVMKRYLEDLGVSTPIQVIPDGTDLQRFRPVSTRDEKVSLRRKLGLDPGCDIILTVGPVKPRKGTDVLVQAFARLYHDHPNALLVLVGPRQDLQRQELAVFSQHLRKTIVDANIQNRVIFTGSANNIEDYMRAADIFVFPSRREGMGYVVPEAMACGIPVVMTPFVGLPEEFGIPGSHYILSDWETQALAADIGDLLVKTDYRRRLGLEGRRWVEQHLDVNRTIDQYAALYRELANSPVVGLRPS